MQQPFEFEREMTPLVAQWLRDGGLAVRTEYPTTLGICDLVGVALDAAVGHERLRLRQRVPINDVRKLALLNAIATVESGRSTSIQALRTFAAEMLDVGDVEEAAAWLQKHGYVRATSGGSYQRRTTSGPLERRIVAIELKLHRVNDAVRQARARLAFATESLVGFPAERARTAATDCRNLLAATGIGLLAVSRDGCELLIQPRPGSGHVHPLMRAHCVERFWPEFRQALSA